MKPLTDFLKSFGSGDDFRLTGSADDTHSAGVILIFRNATWPASLPCR